MNPSQLIDNIQQKTRDFIEQSPFKDIEKNTKTWISSTLSQMDLVTRQEYEVMSALVEKMAEKIEALEKKVADLESR